MKNIVLAIILAGLCVVGANAALTKVDGCYQIGNKEDLRAFAIAVNGDDKNACAELISDIKYSDLTIDYDNRSAEAPNDTWTPIVGFAGTFDGQGHTISGLYYKVPGKTTINNSTNFFDAGFFASLDGNAVVKNLRIQDSYFAADERAGGITADVKSGANVKIDNVSFKGIITSVTADASCAVFGDLLTARINGHFGGLVGTVADGVESFELTNSYNEGVITTSGKCTESRNSGFLIGSVRGESTTLTVTNCYNAGSVERAASTDKVISENKSKGTASVVSQEEYANNIASQKDSTAAALSDSSAGYRGVTFSYSDNKLIATINSSATELKIPQDVFVDKIVIDRVFTPNVYSTIMLPFNVAVSYISGISDAKGFAKFKSVTGENGVFTTVAGEIVNSVSAYTPYLLTTSGTTLVVNSPVTLKATPSSAETTVGDWSFIGTLKKRRWENNDRQKPENAEEIGRVYGFSAANKIATDGVTEICVGDFVKVINRVAILPMRAYLYFNGSLTPAPENKPDPEVSRAPAADVVEPIALDALPSSMKVIIVDPVPASEPEEDPEENAEEEHTTAIRIVKPSVAVNADRWHDASGRSMNKPKTQGVYLNDRTPVVVK